MNEKREKILFGVLAFVIMVSSYPASLGIARLCASVFAEPNLYSWDFVYVSQSPNAHCYHHDLKCEGLRQSKYEIDNILLSEAEDMGRRPCTYCLEKDKLHQFDDAAPYLIMPVIALMCLPFIIYDRIRARKKS